MEKKTVMLGNVEVGAGRPKVIVPIVGQTKSEILAKSAELSGLNFDVVEWRVDFYEDVFSTEAVLATLREMRKALGAKPILFTFRTKKEGGEKEIDMADYTALNTAVISSGDADACDVEIFSGDDVVRTIIDAAHAAGKVVVASILTGGKNEKIEQFGLETLSTYGIMQDTTAVRVRQLIDVLVERGRLKVDPERYNALFLTPSGNALMRGRGEFRIRLPREKKPEAKPRKAHGAELDADVDEVLFDRLREVPPVSHHVLRFTVENVVEIEEILDDYRAGRRPNGGITRGLSEKGVF